MFEMKLAISPNYSPFEARQSIGFASIAMNALAHHFDTLADDENDATGSLPNAAGSAPGGSLPSAGASAPATRKRRTKAEIAADAAAALVSPTPVTGDTDFGNLGTLTPSPLSTPAVQVLQVDASPVAETRPTTNLDSILGFDEMKPAAAESGTDVFGDIFDMSPASEPVDPYATMETSDLYREITTRTQLPTHGVVWLRTELAKHKVENPRLMGPVVAREILRASDARIAENGTGKTV